MTLINQSRSQKKAGLIEHEKVIHTYISIWLTRQGAQLPHQHPKSPGVRGFTKAATLQRLQCQPLDWPIFTVTQTMVVGWEEITRQRVVGQFYQQLVIDPVVLKSTWLMWWEIPVWFGCCEVRRLGYLHTVSCGYVFVNDTMTVKMAKCLGNLCWHENNLDCGQRTGNRFLQEQL